MASGELEPDIEFVHRNSSILIILSSLYVVPCIFKPVFVCILTVKTGLKMKGTAYREEGMV